MTLKAAGSKRVPTADATADRYSYRAMAGGMDGAMDEHSDDDMHDGTDDGTDAGAEHSPSEEEASASREDLRREEPLSWERSYNKLWEWKSYF